VRPRAARRAIIDDFGAVSVSDLRRAVGGRRRFNLSDRVTVTLDTGRAVEIELVPRRTNLGHVMKLLQCPACGRAVTMLRLLPVAPFLGCRRDLQVRLAARYRSQVQARSTGRQLRTDHAGARPLEERSPLADE
jgi:hypothetical protein